MTRAGCSKSDGLSRILWGKPIHKRNWNLSLLELQVPILLFSTLCCAFWLSFAGIGAPYLSPTIWPLIWLAVTAAILFDPLPLLFRSSRLWFLRTIGKLLVSGIRTVEVCCISLLGDLIRTDTSFLSSPISGWGESSVHRGQCLIVKSSAVTSSVVWYSVCLICTRSSAYTSMASKKTGPIADLSQMLGLSPSYLPLCHFLFV